jgi:aspartate/tyrosine/aromatic aminotransferase
MFETVEMAPPDAILGLTEAFNKDPNPRKINLSVGVFQDADGKTPILQSVKQAERRLLEEEKSKGYLPINGLPDFSRLTQELVLGSEHDVVTSQRCATLQTPGGTAALRVAADLVKCTLPKARFWCSKPTWPNHPKVFQAADRQVEYYPYLDAAGTGLDLDAMLGALGKCSPGDVVLLHAGCHNPTGVDPKPDQWRAIADVLQERRLLPLVDFAYQGFGLGLEEDAQGVREICGRGIDLLVCSSYSKNFGLYCERVGALTIVATSSSIAQTVLSQAKVCVRVNYSNPPKHGGAIVATVLNDPSLRQLWESEVNGMRDRIHAMRRQFVEAMKQRSTHDFSFITSQRGMFSYTGLTPVQVDELRSRFGIYIVSAGGRVNVAGLTPTNIPVLCDALVTVL